MQDKENMVSVPIEVLLDFKQRINTLAGLTLKRERHSYAIALKQDINEIIYEYEQTKLGDSLI